MEEKKKTVFADLGQKGYREVWELQERLLEKVKDNVGGECTAQTKAKLTELNRLEKRRSDVDSLFTRMYEDQRDTASG